MMGGPNVCYDPLVAQGGGAGNTMTFGGGGAGATGGYGANFATGGAGSTGMGGAGYNVAGGGPYGGAGAGYGNVGGGYAAGPGGAMGPGGPVLVPGGPSMGPGGPGMGGMGPGGAPPPGSGDPCGCGPPASAGDCAGACGGMETMCCEAEGASTSVSWVPATGGSYAPMTSYQFAGEGSGAYDKQVTTTYYGWRVRKCCIALLALLLLSALLWLLTSLSGSDSGGSEPPANRVVAISTPVPTKPAPIVVVTTPAPRPTTKAPTPAPTTPAPTPAPTTPLPAVTAPPPPVPVPVIPVAPPVVVVPTGPTQTCLVFGDPHVKTFDGQRADYYTPGEYWIVKSPTVWIQGRYLPTKMTKTLSVTKEIGIGGPFLKGHKLVIGVDQVTYDGAQVTGPDGAPVMNTFESLNSVWTSPGTEHEPIKIEYNAVGTVMQKSRVGKALHVMHVHLPGGVLIEVNRWAEPEEGHYINSRIEMAAIPGMDGHCGNFNGVPTDDTRVAVRGRVGKDGVSVSDMIFTGPKTPINPGNRPDLNDCPAGALKIAMDKCKAIEHAFFPSQACLIDTCLGGLHGGAAAPPVVGAV